MKQRSFKTFALLLALILIFSILNPTAFAMTTDPHIHDESESCSEHDHDAESFEADSEAAADKSQDASQEENSESPAGTGDSQQDPTQIPFSRRFCDGSSSG